MPIKIGNVEIATVFKGNTELDNIRLGDFQQWVGIIVTPDPSIAYVSRTASSLTFDLTNNHTETVTIYYGTGNPYPNGSTVSVAASATERVTLSGLLDSTSYTISAVALEAEQLPSVGTVSFTETTAVGTTAAPSIFNVNPDVSSVSFTLRNNDDETAVVYYEVNDSTPDIQVTLAPNATTNRTISGLSGGTGYTLFARAKQSNENFSSTVSTGFTTDFNFGPGPTSVIAGNSTTGFFGEVSQSTFGKTMTSVMADLGITEGTAFNTSENMLKFVHNGTIKYINKKPIRYSISWDHIASKINVYGGTTMTFGGNSYKVRLMRGWGQVSGSTSSLTTPNYQNGPLYTYPSMVFGNATNSGVNWPTNSSGWSANNPNEWNTLIFPISSSSQDQTSNVPNWASFSNTDLNIANGNGRATWTQETPNTDTSRGMHRGYSNIQTVSGIASFAKVGDIGLRLVFELV